MSIPSELGDTAVQINFLAYGKTSLTHYDTQWPISVKSINSLCRMKSPGPTESVLYGLKCILNGVRDCLEVRKSIFFEKMVQNPCDNLGDFVQSSPHTSVKFAAKYYKTRRELEVRLGPRLHH